MHAENLTTEKEKTIIGDIQKNVLLHPNFFHLFLTGS